MKTIFILAFSLLSLFPAVKDGGKTNTGESNSSSIAFTCGGQILVEVDDVNMTPHQIGTSSACVVNKTSVTISVLDTDDGETGDTYYLDPNEDRFFPADGERSNRTLITEGAQ